MGSESSKQDKSNPQLFTSKNEVKIKKTVTIASKPITFDDSAEFDTYKNSEDKKTQDGFEFSAKNKNLNEGNNFPVLKSILKPSKYPPLIKPSILEHQEENESFGEIDFDQKLISKNPIPIFTASEPIFINDKESLFLRNDDKVVLSVPMRKVISNPNLPVARPVIISQQAIPKVTMEWLDAQTKIIPIRKKISPQKAISKQELASQSDSNIWKKYFKSNKLEEAKKSPTKNLGFQNQSDEVYLLPKKVKTFDFQKNSSLPMLPVIQSNVPMILISNRTLPLKIDEINKRKK
jgi:hypothetical protein